MSSFSDERIAQWREYFFEYKEPTDIFIEINDDAREKVKNIHDGRTQKGEDPFGMALVIKNQKWAVKKVNSVNNGLLLGLKDQFIIYDFDKLQAIPTPYSKITSVNRDKSVIIIGLDNEQQIILDVNLNAGTEAAKGCLTVLFGIMGSTKNRHDHTATRTAAGDYIDDANKMTSYLDSICSFFAEGAKGHPPNHETF